jgi:hypothetical protein
MDASTSAFRNLDAPRSQNRQNGANFSFRATFLAAFRETFLPTFRKTFLAAFRLAAAEVLLREGL